MHTELHEERDTSHYEKCPSQRYRPIGSIGTFRTVGREYGNRGQVVIVVRTEYEGRTLRENLGLDRPKNRWSGTA